MHVWFGLGWLDLGKRKQERIGILIDFQESVLSFQYADLNRHVDALNAWRNATVLKPEHSLAWNNMIILLDNTGAE